MYRRLALIATCTTTLHATPPELAPPILLTKDEIEKHTAAKPAKAAADGPVTGFAVDTSNRTAVLALYHNAYLPSNNYAATHGWTGDVGSCDPGTTSADLVADVRRRVNYFRAMAGLNADITFDPSNSAKCQQAALIMSRQRGLSHSPDVHWPANPCLTPGGIEAAGASNLSLGRYGPAAVQGQLIDDGVNNAAAGHRRWILYSRARVMGTGDIPGNADFLAANSLWVVGDFGPAPSPAPAIAWPPAGYVPYDLAPNVSQAFPRWSYGFPGANFSSATVTMKKGAVDVPVSTEPVTTGAGDNTIVWRPSGIPSTAPDADTTYTVSITGITGPGPASVSYDVILVDPLELGTQLTLSGTTSPATGRANTYSFTPFAEATAYRSVAATFTSGNWAEGAESSPAPQVIDLTDASYTLRDTAHQASGSRAFHLAFPDSDAEEMFVIDREVVPLAGSAVRFKYRRLFMHPDSKLRVQLSRDGGGSFSTVTTIAGNNTGTSADFDPASFRTYDFPLPPGYIGRPVKLRFFLEDEGLAFIGTSSNHGIYIDDVTLTNSLQLTGGTPVTHPSTASSITYTPSAVGEARLLMAGIESHGHFFGYGQALQVQSIAAPAGPSPTFAQFAASHGISTDPSVDGDGDGYPSLLEWALGLTDPADPSSVPLIIPGTEAIGPDTYLTASYLRFTGGTESADTYTHAPLTYSANASTGLRSWPLAPNHTTTATGLPAAPAGFAWATLRFPDPTTSASTGSIRLSVTLQ